MAVSFLFWYAVNAANALADRVDLAENGNRMPEVAQSALEQLTESPGDPSNWKTFEANSIGLAESRGVLDRNKVEQFSSLVSQEGGYDNARALLSLNRQGGAYLFNLGVYETDGREVRSIGSQVPDDASVASASRTMAMDGRLVRVSMRVWEIR